MCWEQCGERLHQAGKVHAGVLASGGEDRRVCVWDLEKTAAPGAAPEPGLEKRAGRSIPQLVFSHAGHRASVSAHKSCTQDSDLLQQP